MYCKACGLEIDNDSKYCIFCGHSIYEDKLREQREKEKTQNYISSSEPMTLKDKVIVKIFIGFIVLLFFVTCYAAWYSSSRQEQQHEKIINSYPSNYYKIQNGMTYNEVCKIMGSPGNVISMGVDDEHNFQKIFTWTDYGVIIRVTFISDKVYSKEIDKTASSPDFWGLFGVFS